MLHLDKCLKIGLTEAIKVFTSGISWSSLIAGFPEFMQFGEFLQKFHSAAGTLSRSMSDMDEKQVS